MYTFSMKDVKEIFIIGLDDALQSSLLEHIENIGYFSVSCFVNMSETGADQQPNLIIYTESNISKKLQFLYPTALFLQISESGQGEGSAFYDAFIPLPVKLGEVLSKVWDLCFEHVPILNEQVNIGGGEYVFCPQNKKLKSLKERSEIFLTDKEVHILSHLYRYQGRMVSKEQLLQDVWKYHKDATTHTLETHIYRLRQKIETLSKSALIILTDVGGYKINL